MHTQWQFTNTEDSHDATKGVFANVNPKTIGSSMYTFAQEEYIIHLDLRLRRVKTLPQFGAIWSTDISCGLGCCCCYYFGRGLHMMVAPLQTIEDLRGHISQMHKTITWVSMCVCPEQVQHHRGANAKHTTTTTQMLSHNLQDVHKRRGDEQKMYARREKTQEYMNACELCLARASG